MGEENTLFKDLISSGILRPVMKPRIQKKLLKGTQVKPFKSIVYVILSNSLITD